MSVKGELRGVPRKGDLTSVNMRVRTRKASREKHNIETKPVVTYDQPFDAKGAAVYE